jgi:beta-phosphoglucomutase-like phosphatase (HAD superfamily)
VVIEDSASGARAAQAAAMRCLGLTRDTPAEKLTAHGAEPIDRLDQVPERLGLSSMARQSGWETGDKEDGILVSRLM